MKNLILLALLLAVLISAPAIAASDATFDYSTSSTSTLTAAAGKWTLQMPTNATVTGRVRGLSISTSGGACEFTVYRDGSLATSGTALTVAKVTATIGGAAVPAAQAVAYAGSNSTGGTQIGPVYRLAATDKTTILYPSKLLAPGEVITLVSGTCTTTADVSFLHSEP
jgi:hypothetical protein